MAEVRSCIASDMSQVANLFMQVFRHDDQPATTAMRDYFAQLYLENPWVDPARPPLVAADDDGRIVGFLGALPMPLRLKGRPISAVIGGSFMVDPAGTDPLLASRLLKRFLAGTQDLAFTDTANPVALRFWEGLGGCAAPFQSMRWLLPLRAASLGLALATRDGRRGALRVTSPFAKALDVVSSRRLRPRAGSANLRDASASAVFDAFAEFDRGAQLCFGGTLVEFEWLVDMMRQKTKFGALQLLTLHDGTSAVQGAAIFYPNPGSISQLVAAVSAPGAAGRLVAALRQHAYDHGSAGIMGHADSRLAMEMRGLPCVYLYRNDFVAMHARDPEVLVPLRTGEVAMSRLTGEWWTRFQGDLFD